MNSKKQIVLSGLHTKPVSKAEPISTKHCPNCGNTYLGLIRTKKLKYCPDCNTWIPWNLDEGQQVLA